MVPEWARVQERGPILVTLLVLVASVIRAVREAFEVGGLAVVEPDVVPARAVASTGGRRLPVEANSERAVSGRDDHGGAELGRRAAEPPARVVEAGVDEVRVEEVSSPTYGCSPASGWPVVIADAGMAESSRTAIAKKASFLIMRAPFLVGNERPLVGAFHLPSPALLAGPRGSRSRRTWLPTPGYPGGSE